jgi:predicted nucleic acid-binding protein
MIRELAKVLRTGLRWPEDRIQRRIRVVAQVARIISPRTTLQVVTVDPDDDRILECATEGNADLIVSNDHHLSSGSIPPCINELAFSAKR